MPPRKTLVLALALACAPAAHADTDLEALKAEITAMKQTYEARIAALEARLADAENHIADNAPADTMPAEATIAAAPPASAAAFNPETSLILSGRYTYMDGPSDRSITGFLPLTNAEGTSKGLNLDGSELVFAANVDPYWRGQANFTVADDAVEVEEAWFQSIGLGHGLSVKGGRFLSGLGYLNEQHPHAWDFADGPLMYQALFGEHFIQDGLQVKWLAPTDTFLELGLEAGAGNAFPGASGDRNGLGAWTAFAHIGDDVGVANSWRAGLAYLDARPHDRDSLWSDLNDVPVTSLFTGRSHTWVADMVWKWAPDGNPKYRNFKFQAEYFHRSEGGDLSCDDADTAQTSLCSGGAVDTYAARQSGWYAQAVYQFMPAWRAGLRYDRLDSGSVDFGLGNGALLANPAYQPTRYSLMLDWSPSEFSRLRLQYARDEAMANTAENQWTLQYIMSLGAHGAHAF